MTTIEWTDESWNPIRAKNLATGGVGHFCVAVSPGCKRCYAERFQPRRNNPIRYAAQDQKLVRLFLDDDVVRYPIGWQRARHIFPCSMTDLFADFHPDAWIDTVLAVAALTPRHTYQCLTKRAERMNKYFTNWPDGSARKHHVFSAAHALLNRLAGKTGWSASDPEFARASEALKVWPLPNWWQGVSVEDRERAEERVPLLMKTDVAKRWVSAEPLLEAVDLSPWLVKDMRISARKEPSLDWVVVGGESGPKARSFYLEWGRAILLQCRDAGVPAFFKQAGSRPVALVDGVGPVTFRYRAAKGGDPEEWPKDLRVRQYPS